MAELIPTGVTFGTGRKSLNSFFSATTFSEILSKGLGLSALWVNGSMSASTIYSGSTDLSDIITMSSPGSTSPFSGNPITGGISPLSGANNVSGNFAFSVGQSNLSSGDNSFSQGQSTSATSTSAHAEGVNTSAGGYASHAEGYNTTASGLQSHAEGANTLASANQTHAEGSNTSAIVVGAHAEGSSTLASGGQSHAEGSETTASGLRSHSEGDQTTASGNQSHAGGLQSVADGDVSFVHSSGSTVSADHSSIIGGRNNTLSSTATGSTILGGEFINGTEANRVYFTHMTGQTISAQTVFTGAISGFSPVEIQGTSFEDGSMSASNNVSASTFYSGSTELSEVFPSFGNISVTTESGTQGGFSYSLKRITIGGFKMFIEIDIPLLNSGTTITGMTIAPSNFLGRRYFKLNSMLVSYPNVYEPGVQHFGQGTINFNNLLNTGATTMQIDLQGKNPGTFVYLDDTITGAVFSTDSFTSIEYNTQTLPDLSINPIQMGITGRTGYAGSGDTKVIIEAMLI